MDSKEFIKKKIQEYDNTIDVEDGTATGDLIINPLSSILQPFMEFEKRMERDLSLQDVEKMSQESLDEIASNFLVDRSAGKKASGDIRFFYNTPRTVTIPAGTRVSTNNGTQYETTSTVTITQSQMLLNNDSYPLYHTGDIAIEAIEVGEKYEQLANTVTNLDSILDPEPVSIRNPQALSGGVDGETNTALKTKIQSAAHSKSLSGKNSILRVLRENFSTIDSIEIIGMQDAEMLRDITYSGLTSENIEKVDFQYKVSGLFSPPYNESIAYIGKFEDTDASTDISLPDVDDFSNELTNEMYKGIYKETDPLSAEYKTDRLLEEHFENSSYDAQWVASDGRVGFDELITPKDVVVEGQEIRLGHSTVIDDTAIFPAVPIPYKNLQDAIDQLEQFYDQGVFDKEYLQKTLERLNTIADPQEFNNASPVFQRPLDKHQGIQVTGSFRTTDNTEEGQMSYVTVNRNTDIAVPWDGMGLAWRKGDGSKYNIYIVDNDALTEDIYINHEQIVTQTGGFNKFLVAGKKEIKRETNYDFVIKVYQHFGMDVWIYESANPPANLTSTNRDLTMGQTYPAYEPQANGEHFGVGTIYTKNYEWFYSDLVVENITEFYPMHLFKLKAEPEDFADDDPITINYYGIGYGDTQGRMKCYVDKNGTWELVGTNEKDTNSTKSERKLTKSLSKTADYRDAGDYINVLATPYNYEDNEHYIQSDYVSITNVLPSGVHTGNMIDIYIEDDQDIETTSVSTILTDDRLDLSSSVHFPIADVISISRTTTGAELESGVDYVVNRGEESLAFSTRDEFYIYFDPLFIGIDITITYRYYSSGKAVQSLIDSDEYRNPGQDPLMKIIPLTIVNIANFEYKGNVASEEVVAALKSFINNIDDGKLEISDLVNAVYNVGVTYVNIPSITISVREYSYLGTYTETSVTDTYKISGLKTFFADEQSIIGVTQIT